LEPTFFANGGEVGGVRERALGSPTHPLAHRGAWRRKTGRGSSAPPLLRAAPLKLDMDIATRASTGASDSTAKALQPLAYRQWAFCPSSSWVVPCCRAGPGPAASGFFSDEADKKFDTYRIPNAISSGYDVKQAAAPCCLL
jgi:hypothetical protein